MVWPGSHEPNGKKNDSMLSVHVLDNISREERYMDIKEVIRQIKAKLISGIKNKWLSVITLGGGALVRKSIINGVYVGFGILIILIFFLSIGGGYNIKSINSSVEDITDVNIPLNNQSQDIEIKLLSLSVRLYDVINSNSEEELERQKAIMNRSREEFENSLNKFIDFSRNDQELMRGMSKVADLSRDYLDIIDVMPELKHDNLLLLQNANKSQADFIAWLPVFRQMLQELKLKVFDDYVDNLMLNLLTYQSLAEKKVLEALGSNNTEEIVKARKSIEVFLDEYENWADNLYSEMPEAQNEIGALVANFKYSCGDDNGVVGQHERLVENTNALVENMISARDKINEIKTEITNIQLLVSKELSSAKEHAADKYEKSIIIIIVSLILSLGITAGVLFFLSRSIKKPMEVIVRRMKEFAEGDLDNQIVTKDVNEFGVIINNLNRVTAETGEVMLKMADSAKKLKMASTDNLVAADISKNAINEQRNETLNLASAMNEMLVNINDIAKAVSSTMTEIQGVENEAVKSQDIMTESMGKTLDLSDKIQENTKVIKNVSTLSSDIAKIIDIIRGVAEQTNLLALNAAIEAARAGEYGRGFAVVADEVRSLANTTANSANDIRKMIEDLQNTVIEAVNSSEECLKEMMLTKDKAEEASRAIDDIKVSVVHINEMASIIVDSVNKQMKTSESISSNIERISDLSNDNQIQIEALAITSQTLDTLASSTESSLNKFILPNSRKKSVKKVVEEKKVENTKPGFFCRLFGAKKASKKGAPIAAAVRGETAKGRSGLFKAGTDRLKKKKASSEQAKKTE